MGMCMCTYMSASVHIFCICEYVCMCIVCVVGGYACLDVCEHGYMCVVALCIRVGAHVTCMYKRPLSWAVRDFPTSFPSCSVSSTLQGPLPLAMPSHSFFPAEHS